MSTAVLRPRARQAGFVLALTVIWVLLWGTLSVANVASGLLVAVVLIHVLPDVRPPDALAVRPLAVLRLGGYMVRQVLVSNVVVARTVISRRAPTCTGVIALPVPAATAQVVSVTAGLMALTPGAMPVMIEEDPAVIYVHLLDLRDVEAVRRDLVRLRDLTIRAIGPPAAVDAVDAGEARP